MLSFWEHKEFISYDFIIIGSGITGLSVACEIKEQNSTAKILVLEEGLLPTGASTKNAGFACIGTLSEKVHDLELMGEENFLQLIENRWKGLQRLRKRLGDATIDYQNHGGYELILNHDGVHHLGRMEQMNNLLLPLFGKKVFNENKEKVHEFGFSKSHVQSIVVNEMEGQLDTGKMMNALHQYASELGIKIVTGASVGRVEEMERNVEVLAQSATASIVFNASKVVVCTNAFTSKLFPELEIIPGRGQVLVTGPLPTLPFKGIFSFDEGFYYFRNFENRIIFGGGRNLDFDTETTTVFELNEKIFEKLEWYLKEIIIPGQPVEIEQKWAGIMAFGKNKLPIVKQISYRIAVAARLNGMGVALGSKIAEDIAALVLAG